MAASNESATSAEDLASLPSVTVVVCAYTEDRWTMLVEAIHSCFNQSHLPLQIILCIDHNDQLLKRCQDALPSWQELTTVPITVIANRFGGRLGSARNTGVIEAKGDVVVFLDDDAVADRRCFEHLARPYVNSEVVAVGGAPQPDYETSRPRWIPEQMNWVFGCYYDGLPKSLGPTRRLIGASMSARRRDLEAIGGFHSDNHDDMDMCHRLKLERPDSLILLEPKAIVHHKVVAQRVTWNYYWRRCFFVNKSKAVAFREMDASPNDDGDRAFVLAALGRSARGAVTAASKGDFAGVIQFFALVAGVSLAALGFGIGRLEKVTGPQSPTASGLPSPVE